MKNIIAHSFAGLKTLEISELIILGLFVALIPWNWHLLSPLMTLFAVNTVAKMIVSRKMGNDALSRWSRMGLWLMVALYLLHAVSLLYTADIQSGLSMMGRRLPFLIFPLCFLAADSSSLRQPQRRILCGLFVVSLVVKFFFCLVKVVVTTHAARFWVNFDATHHTYMAMYLLFAIGFLYSEWYAFRGSMSKCHIWLLACTAIILMAYTVFVMSRTGIAGLIVMVLAVVVHLFFFAKERKKALLLLLLAGVVGTGVYAVLPENYRRITKTFKGETDPSGDIRWSIMDASLKAIGKSLPFGVGIGDKDDVLEQVYSEYGNEHMMKAQYNSHNMYLDITLTMGVLGILLLLSVIVVPLSVAVRTRDIALMAFLFAFAFSGLFEAILNRMMGTPFVALFVTLLLVTCSVPKCPSQEIADR